MADKPPALPPVTGPQILAGIQVVEDGQRWVTISTVLQIPGSIPGTTFSAVATVQLTPGQASEMVKALMRRIAQIDGQLPGN